MTASFKYDALNRRIEKTINGRTTQYLYDGLDIIQEIKDGMATVNYIRSLNIDEPLARLDVMGGVRFYHTDALGSVIALTDELGEVRTQYNYTPFGTTEIIGEASDNPFQYTGRENDGTGLYYYRARYYSPEMKRFISEDPIGFAGGVNFYSYVGNNAINWVDSLGLDAYSDAVTVVTSGLDVLATYKNVPKNPAGAALFLTSTLADKSNALVAFTSDNNTKSYIGLGLGTIGTGAAVLGTSPVSAFLSGYGLGTSIFYMPVEGLDTTVGDWWLDRLYYDVLHPEEKICK